MPKRIEIPDWMKEPEIADWLNQFKEKKNYRRNIIAWVNWIKMEPKDQLEKRRADLKSDDMKTKRFFEEKVKEFGKDMMKRGLKRKTGEQYLIAVRSFYSFHYMPMKFRRGEISLEENEIVKASKKPKMVISDIEHRAIFSMCNLRDKPLYLILTSTGLSETDVANLRIEGLRLYENGDLTSEPVYGIKFREKTNIEQHFILGREVLYYLKPLLAERDYPREGYLLLTRRGNAYNQRIINMRIKELAEKALGEKAVDFKTKNLRDFFMNGLRLAEIEKDVFDAMVGWKREGASNHYKIADVVILQAYKKAQNYWSIDGEQLKGDKQREINDAFMQVIMSLREENTQLKLEMATLKSSHIGIPPVSSATLFSPIVFEKTIESKIRKLHKLLRT